ncbi:MAG TPA: DHHA1 domain-containing protein, partial [Rubricoccaceae bacterium]|nr:DHHA1 domain-containing protein [Rubricoccaceae bacterium]
FEELMTEQRERARAAGTFGADHSQVDTWDATSDTPEEITFVGYDTLSVEDARILRTRTIGEGGNARHELVLDKTPFYAESGGQVGDTGTLTVRGETITVLDTVKDAEGTIIHVVDKLPTERDVPATAEVDASRRARIVRHHSATHLLHAALREVLGTHVQQRGSLVAPDRLRFDFAHYERVDPEQQRRIERRVNELVLRNVPKGEERAVPIEEAKARGAMALFGEKYGDVVRVITFEDPEVQFSSVELCGGTHAASTGEIGLFRLVSEGSVASGIRRVEAVAGEAAIEVIEAEREALEAVRGLFKTQLPVADAVAQVLEEKRALEKELAELRSQQAAAGLGALLENTQDVDGVRLVTGEVPGADMDALRDLAEQARERLGENAVAVLGSADAEAGKAYLAAAVTDDLVKAGVQAGKLVGALAKRVGGGGGGRPHLATAGGREPAKLADALAAAPDELRALRG